MSADGSASLLYVEDHVLIRETVEVALREAGFKLTVADSGAAALALLEADPNGFRGLITDIDLGGETDGWAVARRARELREELPVIYVSGGSEHDWASKGVPHSVMIAKPFAPAQVIVAISTLLLKSDA